MAGRPLSQDDPQQSHTEQRWVWFLAAALTLAGFLFFLPSLNICFVSDDVSHILEAAENLAAIHRPYYRPLTELSLHLDRLVWRMHPFGFHLTNLVLHLAGTVLLLWVGVQLGLNRMALSLAGLVFLVHPVHGPAIFWISGRTDLLCTLFYLLALGVFLARLTGPRRFHRGVSLLFLLLALLSKEMAVSFPLVAGAATWLLAGPTPRWKKLRQLWTQTSPYWLLVLLFILFRLLAAGSAALSNPVHQGIHPLAWLRNGAAFAALLILPAGHRQLADWALDHPAALLVLGSLALLSLWGLLAYARHRPVACFLILFTAFSLLPVLRFAMRWYAYLPSVGFALLAGHLLAEGPAVLRRWRLPLGAAAAGLILVFAFFLHRQQQAWIRVSEQADALADRLAEAIYRRQLPAAYVALVPAEINDVPVFRYGLEKNIRYRVSRLAGRQSEVQVRALSYARLNRLEDLFLARIGWLGDSLEVDLRAISSACFEFPYQPAVLAGRVPLQPGLSLHRPEAETRILKAIRPDCATRVAVRPRYSGLPVLTLLKNAVALVEPDSLAEK
ncbi:MAG: hypothetical protein D6715_14250 [Calditrichaeota bacterium]|nr:MAG: hypothetical protein D6715_14250 [Calditrichota bacterium]